MTGTESRARPKGATAKGNGNEPTPDLHSFFPVPTLQDALPYLRQPFAPEAVGFKPQHEGQTATLVVAYIDARLVIERLNLVIGENWTARFEKAEDLGARIMWCHLTVGGVTRSDVGEGNGKALVSDSLKRAAVHFGIGRSLYATPQMFVKTAELDGTGKTKRLSDKQRLKLRKEYEAWLKAEGIPAFGAVLLHGDAEAGSVGTAIDPEATAQAEDPSEVKTISADQAASLRDRFDALEGDPKEHTRELKLLLGSIGASGRSVNTAFAKLTPTQMEVVSGWLEDAGKS